ncbi:MAG: PKD domain-containing protein [Chitinispirillaceae bacterium]|nr:PKD domain-containing protein [Chitinispirillaceae bacterium]
MPEENVKCGSTVESRRTVPACISQLSMKKSHYFFLVWVILLTFIGYPADYSWDNSTLSGIQTGNGIWGINNYWTINGITLVSWPGAGASATFAGSDGTYAITVSGTQNVDSITFKSDGYTLATGTLDFGTTSGICVDSNKTAAIGSVINGTGGLSKYGPGTLIISGTSTFTGPTEINGGTLIVNGSIAAGSAVTVNSNAILGGEGTVNGVVTVSAGGSLAPGFSGAGKLTTGNLSLGGSSLMKYELGTLSDTIAVNGNLTLDATVDIEAAAGFGPGTYTLLTYVGTLTLVNDGLTIGSTPGGYDYTITATAGEVRVTVTPLTVKQWIGGAGDNRWNTAANWSGGTVPVSSDSVVFLWSAYPCSLDVDDTVECLMFEPDYAQAFYFDGNKLTISRRLSINISETVIGNGSDTICFDGTGSREFRSKTGILLPTVHQKGTGTTTVVTEGFRASNLYVTAGEFNFGEGLESTVDGLLKVDGGSLNINTSMLLAVGDVDFSGATALLESSGGALVFQGGMQLFIPGNEIPSPHIVKNSSTTLTVAGNRLITGRLQIMSGQVTMDTALFADTVYLSTSLEALQLDTAEGNIDTINSLQGYGTINFGKTDLHISKSVDLNGFNSVGGTGNLTFINADVIDFTPKTGFSFQKIEMSGSGTVRVNNLLKSTEMFIHEGTWDWYNSGIDTVTDTIGISGGTMKLSTSMVYAKKVTGSGGTLRFNTGTLTIFGDTGRVQLSALSTVFPDTGLLIFNGTGVSTFEFQQNPAQVYPVIRIEGNSADTVRMMSNLNAKCLRQISSTLKWGSGLLHTVDTLDGIGGAMDFGSSIVTVTVGKANLSSLSGIISGTGEISFSGTAGTQVLTPPSALSCPIINKAGTGTVQLSSNNLTCKGLSISEGTFDFAGKNATINGDLTVVNGSPATFNGLDGVTVSVSGNASLAGQSGNQLNLDPSTVLNLNVTGTLEADYATIANCNADGATGQATATCVDNGGNTNWYFIPPDVTPPTDGAIVIVDNSGFTADIDPPLTVGATDADSMRLGLAADTALATWREYATSDSINISSGGEGGRRIFVQFKDFAGNRSAWVSDSTTYDATAPGGSITIHDSNDFTADPEPALTITATGADSMRLGLADDTASSTWKAVVSPDSLVISSGGDGGKRIFVQFKDLAGNRSVWASDSTTYDTTAPGGSIVITDNSGFTADPDPRLAITAAGADSMRLGLAADTASASWKAYSSVDSIVISSGGEGGKRIFVQFRDSIGNRSAWMSDSITFDNQLPVTTIATGGTFNYLTWPGFVNGSATDNLSGIDTVVVTVVRQSDGTYWNGNGASWQSFAYQNCITTTGAWQISLPPGALNDGSYTIAAKSSDRAGNSESPGAIASFAWYCRPAARFSAEPTQGMVPLTVDFIDSSTGGVGSRQWDFGDGATDTARHVIHIYQIAGAFTVSLKVHGTGGSDTLTKDSLLRVGYPPPVVRFSSAPNQGAAPLQVQMTDSSTGSIIGRLWTFGDGGTDSAQNPHHIYTEAGTYQVTLKVWGPGGADSASATPITASDTTKPLPLVGLNAVALNCSTMVLTWNQSSSTDADSVSINVSYTGFAASPLNGDRITRLPHTKTADTLRGLPPDGVVAFIRTFVRDRAGNWSDTGTTSLVSVKLSDGRAPSYSLSVSLQSVRDSVVLIGLTVDGSAEPGIMTVIGSGRTKLQAADSVRTIRYADTVITTAPQFEPGWFFAASAVQDSAGNRSALRYDSVAVANTPPRISIVADTLLREDTVWNAQVTVGDFNGDSVRVSIVDGPKSVILSGLLLSWTPDDADIGKSVIVLVAEDIREGKSYDTVTVTVSNREEPPVISVEGDTMAYEDLPWAAHLVVADPDQDEKHSILFERKPTWVIIDNDTLTGTPAEEHVGTDTLRCVVSDRSGLRDTLELVLKVRNVNDTPAVVSNSLPGTIFEKQTASGFIIIADPDRFDTLAVFWEEPCAWLSAGAPLRDTVSRQWSITLRASPQQKDTGMAAFVLRFTDREGAVAVLRDTVMVLDADDPPTPPKIRREVVAGAVRYTVTASDDRDTELIYAVRLRSLDDTSWSRSDRSSPGDFRFYPLVDGQYRFEATAIDRAGLETMPVFDTLLVAGASRCITSDTAWEMFSVPVRYETGRLPNTKYLLHWDESISERQIYHYYLQKHEIDVLEPGKGYWRKGTGKRDTIEITRERMTVQPVKVALTRTASGWNQIASPCPYPVVWRGKSSVLWKWNPLVNDFEEIDSILEPWFGYWVQSDLTDSVMIDTVPVLEGKPLAKRKKTWFSGNRNWVLQAVLTTDGGMDAENRFGIHPDAKDGYDRLDRPEPPRPADLPALFFPHTDWKRGLTKYASDFRREWAPVNIFEIGITGSVRPGAAKIRFNGFEKGMPLYLFMTAGDTIISIDPETEVTIPEGTADSYRTLFVVDNPAALQLLPLRFSMGNAYPNPFCPSTRIKYVLPYRWLNDGKMVMQEYVVSIDIYDLMGRKIRNLLNRKMPPGSYEVFWDGKNGSGRIAASGHYYCRLTADKFESVKNLTVVR